MSYDLVALGNPLLDMQIRGGEKVLEKVRIGKVKGGEEIADWEQVALLCFALLPHALLILFISIFQMFLFW